ncbi:hypothetical protein [Agromyces soli]|uniref:alpha/beta fold hydrolase n=1 Tax=Agromyces soli TaxID=659012 RepID=UPI0031DBF850
MLIKIEVAGDPDAAGATRGPPVDAGESGRTGREFQRTVWIKSSISRLQLRRIGRQYLDRGMVAYRRPRRSPRLAEFVPGVEVLSLDTGHRIQEERPEETTRVMLDWLRRQETRLGTRSS